LVVFLSFVSWKERKLIPLLASLLALVPRLGAAVIVEHRASPEKRRVVLLPPYYLVGIHLCIPSALNRFDEPRQCAQ
jgi:hypothetical protein